MVLVFPIACHTCIAHDSDQWNAGASTQNGVFFSLVLKILVFCVCSKTFRFFVSQFNARFNMNSASIESIFIFNAINIIGIHGPNGCSIMWPWIQIGPLPTDFCISFHFFWTQMCYVFKNFRRNGIFPFIYTPTQCNNVIVIATIKYFNIILSMALPAT